jgi:hypothetical protein
VTGTVMLDGKPIVGGPELRGTVSYFPASGTGVQAVGIIDDKGQYQLSTGSESGVAPGSYDVAIMATRIIIPEPGATPGGRPITPAHYANSQESKLHAEVQPGTNTIDFALVSKAGSPEQKK